MLYAKDVSSLCDAVVAACGGSNTASPVDAPGAAKEATTWSLEVGAALNEELIQCVIHDGNVKDAKPMGVEYIVSERLFKTLPRDKQALWRNHVYEVKSGALIAPGIPEVAERELMRKLVGTYGKTSHTWHTDLHKVLPTAFRRT